MKIAFCNRPNYTTGGDGIQMLKTKEYLEKIYSDISIDIITSPKELSCKYDIAHIFNYASHIETRAFFEQAKLLNVKIVSSTIFWDYSYAIMPLPMILGKKYSFIKENYIKTYRFLNQILSKVPLEKFRKAYFPISRAFSSECKFFIENSDLILPNSYEEGILCCNFAKYLQGKDKIREVYNGVDIQKVDILPESSFFEKYKIPKNYILQVGRVEYSKNQLNLVGSLMDRPDIPIVILGNNQYNLKYTSMVKRLASKRGNVFFVSNVPHDEVYSFYKYAKLHVLLSLRESPGLVSMEALSQGCPIVVSDKRFLPLDTYFSEQCIAVNPFDKTAIQEAILKQMEAEHKVVDMSKFEWSVAAAQTYNAYKEVLA